MTTFPSSDDRAGEHEARPDPDQLLAQVRAAEAGARRGSLKIFFGYAPGVGKTYAMLENARRAKAAGRDVVVGYVEPHDRPETAALAEGLECLPVQWVPHRDVAWREFDIDAALARQPELILVDELAHTNAPGRRHGKRWQDVEELLDAGIDVWTTLNVQHLESLNDVIGQITGIVVRETVPDHLFDRANELELVDITPDELLTRLEAGKVYISAVAQRAIQNFFQKSNLTALRELSLRQAAQRIHTDVETARRAKAARPTWGTAERLLVCVGPSPTTARVIRTAKRMALALDASWTAVSIDLTGEPVDSVAKRRIAQHFRLAEQLGAETITLAGQNVTDTVLDYAKSSNVTKILVGKTRQPRWRRLLLGTVVDELLERSGDIDVYVIQGDGDKTPHARRSGDPGGQAAESVAGSTAGQFANRANVATADPIGAESPRFNPHPYVKATLVTGFADAIAYGLRFLHFADAEANTVMILLAAVAAIAFRYGRGPSMWASLLAVLSFDFFFVPPFHTFVVEDAQYLVTFSVMLGIGAIIGSLTARLRAQVESTRQRERRTTALYELGKQLGSLYGRTFLTAAAGAKVAELLGREVAIYLRRHAGHVEIEYGVDTAIARQTVCLAAAQWAIDHDQVAGAGTNTLPNAPALFLPVAGSQGTHGAIAVSAARDVSSLLAPDIRRLLESCANLLALALERDQSTIDAAEARVQAEAEQVRSSLLSGVSHDLKTPLATLAGASSSLLAAPTLDESSRRELLQSIADEASRLNRLVDNILQMSRLEAGAAMPNRQWHVLEELVGSALHRTRRELAAHRVDVELPADLSLLWVDGMLIEQLLVNLLENAARYTSPGATVTIRAGQVGNAVRIAVSDNGPGLPPGAEERVFEKFYRASPRADAGRGSGLGLAICRAIAKVHGGDVRASNRPSGGAEFVIQLPQPNERPQIAASS